jgi:hypothetical protein
MSRSGLSLREQFSSVTHPESGTTLFSYNNDGTVAEKRDAKLQKLVHEYDADANGRLKLVKRLLAGGGEDVCQRVRSRIAWRTRVISLRTVLESEKPAC